MSPISRPRLRARRPWRSGAAVTAALCILVGAAVLAAGGRPGVAWSLLLFGLAFTLMSASSPRAGKDAHP